MKLTSRKVWTLHQIEWAKFRGAAIARWLRRGELPYRPHPKHGVRLRLMAINLPEKPKRP